MKLRLIISILVLLTFFTDKIHSQNYWEEIFATGPSIFSMDVSDDEVIYLGTANGVWRSFDNGDSWNFDTIYAGNLTVYSLLAKSDGIVYAGCNHKVYQSTDYGENWILIFNEAIGNVLSIYIDSNDNLFVGMNSKLYRSMNNGMNWELVIDFESYETPYCIIEDNQNVLYAGTSTYMPQYEIGGLYNSIDSGITWNHIEATTNCCISDIEINQNGNLICAATYNYSDFIGGVYKFNPTNGNWTVLKSSLIATAIVIDQFNTYYVSSDNAAGPTGCLISYNNGLDWTPINSGLTNINIQTLDISPEGYLFSTSVFPSKVFRSTGSVYTDVNNNLEKDKNYQIFPNPVNNELNIITPPSVDNLFFELINLEGHLVMQMDLRGKKNQINTEELKTGLYLYLFRKNGKILQQGKMIKK